MHSPVLNEYDQQLIPERDVRMLPEDPKAEEDSFQKDGIDALQNVIMDGATGFSKVRSSRATTRDHVDHDDS
jgi:hypothetical protein